MMFDRPQEPGSHLPTLTAPQLDDDVPTQRAKLFAACEKGDADRVWLILHKSEETDLVTEIDKGVVDARGQDGATPLFIAAKNGFDECVKHILAEGVATTSLATSSGLSPLWIAAQKGRRGCVELLLNTFDIKINQAANDGRTPLYAACESGDAKCVRLLLDRKADIERRRNDGSTPLIVAAYFGHSEVVEVLLAAGARLRPRDEDGTALDNARKQKRTACVELLEQAAKERLKDEVDEDAALVE